MSKTYEIEIQKDEETGDAFFELPSELMKKLDWNPGDDLKWDETNEGIRCRKIKYDSDLGSRISSRANSNFQDGGASFRPGRCFH